MTPSPPIQCCENDWKEKTPPFLLTLLIGGMGEGNTLQDSKKLKSLMIFAHDCSTQSFLRDFGPVFTFKTAITQKLIGVPMKRKLLWFHWKDLLRWQYNLFYSFLISVVVCEILRLVSYANCTTSDITPHNEFWKSSLVRTKNLTEWNTWQRD